ncbi:hypothetical protein J1N35_027245 [Gossypium stocksii]|uniref:Uncharacterized protein n=1 Tax=Gossypium stocksii TaxID=47602 RepID=A0A9D3V9P7_9ROSI|nr:hypothetical protein J1N35_027245 [Gossypium stocksii]
MPVAASAIYFLNLQGDVLINRLYRDGFSVCLIRIISHLGETWCTPSEWKSREQKNSLHVPFDRLEVALSFTRDSGMFTSIIIRSNGNANVACAFKFVLEAAGWFKSYFGGAFNEDAIHNNFVLIYEFLVERKGEEIISTWPQMFFESLKVEKTQHGRDSWSLEVYILELDSPDSRREKLFLRCCTAMKGLQGIPF